MKHDIVLRHWLGQILVLTFLCLPNQSNACSCAAFPNDPEKALAIAYAQADVIFLGDAIAVRNKLLRLPPQREAKFSVRTVWKGSTPDTTVVRTNIGESACGYKFKKQGSYLVFGYWDRQHKHLTTSFCDLTRTEIEAKDLIVILNRRGSSSPSPNSTSSIRT